MTQQTTPDAVLTLTNYFGEVGPRWGLPKQACRAHAYLYGVNRPVPTAELADALTLDEAATSAALEFLEEFGLLSGSDSTGWRTMSDPWEMLLAGLAKRRENELPAAIEILQTCRAQAAEASNQTVLNQVGKLLSLVGDLAAIDAQAQRFSPATLRRLVGLSGRAARLFGRS
ncbi:hypothetical protein [Pyruvatibacter sp.]|uniref:hypothetical protein n=1 Tax=Pyruvatibacter sp. TaxID=1981328 RepID=UPI0032636DFF